MKEKNTGVLRLVLRVLQGMLIGVGAVLPGISGGVLCVVFGIYKPVMELLSSPVKKFKTHVPRLLPVIVGAALGFLGVAKVLAFFLEKYPDQSVCLFVGLIGGMLPSLFREAGEQGRTRGSWVSLVAAFAVVLALLLSLNVLSVSIAPSFGWYLFCGFCMALSIIAPGMSFSTLLMPLGLYTPLVDGIGDVMLNLYLALALMTLKLWELASLMGGVLLIVICQVVFIVTVSYFVIFRILGKSYDAAVMCSGLCGHGLGATPTAIVNMTAVTERYGMSSRAFMVVPIVGAFLVDLIYQPQTIAFIKFFVPAASNLVG